MATAAEIEVWIAEAEAQRHAVALGEAVIDIWRDGRRLRKHITTLEELDDYLRVLRSELIEAQIAEGITPTRLRRRAIGLAWQN